MFQSRVNRHVCDVIDFDDKRHFELSTGDVLINIAVSFSLHLLKTCLICHKGGFQNARPLFTE